MSNNNNTNDYNEREGRVLELYDQGKSTSEIAKILRMSLRDIGFILKKGPVNLQDKKLEATINQLII
jgi:DNA-binding NarL/FixJ family response regulator